MGINTTAAMTAAELEAKLSQYDIITFDVFDTLITRSVLHPVDVFSVVEAQAKRQSLLNRAFAQERQAAEQAAYEAYGDGANFSQIYEMLEKRFSYGQDLCGKLMDMELAAEQEVAAPRTPMRELFLRLKNAGKRIVLCSDMYLGSDQIRQLLVRCGYPEDLEIWVSSEHNATKTTGRLWKQLFAALPQDARSIHVGDNDCGDYRSLKQLGREAVRIQSGYAMFTGSPLYDYLSRYDQEGELGRSLVLGWLVNRACFNSPFRETGSGEDITAVWGGAAFASFMDFLVAHRDDSQLLFTTREGYLLKPLYEAYCKALGVEPQPGCLFYASRAATVAATVTSEKDVQEAMQRPEYRGTLGHFVKSRMNFQLPEDAPSDAPIELPAQQREVLRMLKPYLPQIYETSLAQKQAYETYVQSICQDDRALTVVDVGYNGTIQWALSKVLGEKVGGLYMFLNDGAPPTKLGCPTQGIANPRAELHPLYDNLLFLEAVMQVPYGQLRKMTLVNGEVQPLFNEDANFSQYIPVAQAQFTRFVQWMGYWKGQLGSAMDLDFSLAEAIWVCLLKFRYLPKELLDSFWLADDFCGYPVWKYDDETQMWKSAQKETPLDFALMRSGEHLSAKQKLKNFVKKHIPYFAYDWACRIWMRHIK